MRRMRGTGREYICPRACILVCETRVHVSISASRGGGGGGGFLFLRELPGSLYVDFRMAEAATGILENQECCMHVLPN